MRKKNYNWFYGLFASLITLAVLFGGQMVFNKYAMARPMDKIFEQIEGIETFDVIFNEQADNKKAKLHVKLNNVKNLQLLYNRIVSGLDKYGGAKKYDIVISDYRTPRLEEFYYQIHYSLEEAAITGNFVEMAAKIQKDAGDCLLEAKVYVDSGFIYLQLKDLKEITAQMYLVMPRPHIIGSQEAK